ncbi:MAG: ferredoxin [Rubritepida sp.]|nr:ferredoxin [Rubritepida sp.]
MYVILTSKPGQFRTDVTEGLVPVEAYDYVFHGRVRAQFVIAELTRAMKVTVVDEVYPPIVNRVPSKFLPSFETADAARAELNHLTHYGSVRAALEKAPLPVVA